MWMCFAFDLEDDAVRLFGIKILQEMWAHFSLLSFLSYFEKNDWLILGWL